MAWRRNRRTKPRPTHPWRQSKARPRPLARRPKYSAAPPQAATDRRVPPLYRNVHRQAGKTKHRYFMLGQTTLNHPWRASEGNGRGTKAIVAQHLFTLVADSQVGFRSTSQVTLSSMAPHEIVQRLVATVKSGPVMMFVNGLLAPIRQRHYRFGKAIAAASNLSLGAGGLSNRSSARKLSFRPVAIVCSRR